MFRLNRKAFSETLKMGSWSGSVTAVSPVTWISLDSFAELTLSAGTSITVAAPSRRLLAVATARPSFQKSRMIEPMSRRKPKSIPTIELPIRPKIDWLVSSVIPFAIVDAIAGGIESRKQKVRAPGAPRWVADLQCPDSSEVCHLGYPSSGLIWAECDHSVWG